MGRRVSHLIIASLVIIAAIMAVYFQTLHYPFVFDDHYYIVDELRVKSLSGFWPPSGTRYFGFLTFALNYHFGGLDTFGYHIVISYTRPLRSLRQQFSMYCIRIIRQACLAQKLEKV